MLKINTNVPMPDKKSNSSFRSKYPWKVMQVTDSFYIQGKNEGKTRRYMATLSSKVGKKLGKKFFIDESPTGVNVFCIATGLGTTQAKMYDFTNRVVIEFNDAPKQTTAQVEPVVEPVVEGYDSPVVVGYDSPELEEEDILISE